MNYNKKTVYDVDVKGKKVLLRCDFNVPQDKKTGEITSDKRSRPTSASRPRSPRSAICWTTAPPSSPARTWASPWPPSRAT